MSPPIVGVPCFVWWCCGPSSRMCWPNSLLRRNSMNFGPIRIEMIIATIAAISTRVTGPAARERRLLAAPARERNLDGLVGKRQPQYVECEQRCGGVARLVPRGEVEHNLAAEHAHVRATVADLDVDRTEAAHVDVVRDERLELRRVVRDDRHAVRRQRAEDLGLRLGDALDGSEQLEVDRADSGDDGDLRPRDLAELADLAETPHAHLRDHDLGLR